jgi:hypothetical protein
MSDIQKLAANFTDALVALLLAIFRGSGAAESKPGKSEPKTKFPSNFSTWSKAWAERSEKAKEFVGEVIANASCTSWNPEKIDLLVMGSPDFEKQATSQDGVELIRRVFAEDFGFDGAILVRGNSAPGPDMEAADKAPPKKSGRSKAKAEVTIEQVQQACKELADKIGDKEPVKAIVAKFGSASGKVKETDPKHYPAILEAVANYSETTTAENDEF